jgi:hypothetical protein
MHVRCHVGRVCNAVLTFGDLFALGRLEKYGIHGEARVEPWETARSRQGSGRDQVLEDTPGCGRAPLLQWY